MLSNVRKTVAISAFLLGLAALGSQAFAQATGGLDTGGAQTTMPFSITGTQVMTLFLTGLNIGGTAAPDALLSTGPALTTIKVASYDGGPNALYGMGVNAGQLTFGANIAATGTPQMVLTAGGYVGIETTSPSYQLDVGGVVRATSGFMLGNTSSSEYIYDGGAGGGSGTTASNAVIVRTGPSIAYNYFSFDNGGNFNVPNSVHAYAYYHTSDMRLKANIRPIDHALDKILALKGVQFNWKKDGRADMGVVAQNVAEVFPDVVTKGSDGMMSIEYDSLVGPMIEAIRELKAENNDLRQSVAKIDQMQTKLDQVSSSLQVLKRENEKLRSIKYDGTADANNHENLSATP